jgi:hypothetical protein
MTSFIAWIKPLVATRLWERGFISGASGKPNNTPHIMAGKVLKKRQEELSKVQHLKLPSISSYRAVFQIGQR